MGLSSEGALYSFESHDHLEDEFKLHIATQSPLDDPSTSHRVSLTAGFMTMTCQFILNMVIYVVILIKLNHA